jgi:HPt (histidine-containing phosphotransfer) domain-containing protein
MTAAGFSFDKRLDSNFLQSVYEGDLEHAQMVFEQFIEYTPEQIKEIEENFSAGNLKGLGEQIHKIKPMFSFVGLTDLTSEAELLEKKCKEIADVTEISGLYNNFKTNYSIHFPIIQNELSRLKVYPI